MKKIATMLLLSVVSILGIHAASHEIKLNIKESSTSVRLIYRLANSGDKAIIDYGNGEIGTLEQGAAGQLMTTEYTFTTPSSEVRTVSIQANKLIVLRIVSSGAVNGIVSLSSPSLKILNLDYTKLSESARLDFTTCPNIEEITLNDCDVEEVLLPAAPKLKTFQCSPAFLSQKGLKKLDLSRCSSLETLGLKNVALDTVDLRACPGLKQLVLHGLSSRIHPKALLGAKALKSLQRVDIQMCALGYDMLPDLNETLLDQFIVKKLFSITVPSSRIKGLTVDLSYLLKAKGIAEAPQTTIYTWKKKVGTQYEEIDAALINEKDGIFKFSPALLGEDGTCTIRCYLSNPGYPNIAYYTSGYATLAFAIEKPELAVSEQRMELLAQAGSTKTVFKIMAPEGKDVIIDWGDGKKEEIAGQGNQYIHVEHSYAAALEETTTVAIDATDLIAYSELPEDSSIVGFGTINAPVLERIVHIYRSLKGSAGGIVDLSQCPKLTNLSLHNAPGIRLGNHPELRYLSLRSQPADDAERSDYAAITLDKLDLSLFPKLGNILISEQFFNEVDFSNLKALKYLYFADNHTTRAKGLREVTKNSELKEILINLNKLGLDELPVKNPTVTYGNFLIFQRDYPIAKEKIKGTTVDLAHLTSIEAFDGSPVATTFTWKKGDKVILAEAFSESGGVFSFNKNLFAEGEEEVNVYVEMTTPLFSNQELTGHTDKKHRSEPITLRKSDAPEPLKNAKITIELPEKLDRNDFSAIVDGKAYNSGEEVAMGKIILFSLKDTKNEDGTPRYSNVSWSVNGSMATEGFEYKHEVKADAKVTLSATLGNEDILPHPITVSLVNSGSLLLVTGLSSGEAVQLFDLTGLKLLETNEHRIDTSRLPRGVYIVRTNSKSAKVVK